MHEQRKVVINLNKRGLFPLSKQIVVKTEVECGGRSIDGLPQPPTPPEL